MTRPGDGGLAPARRNRGRMNPAAAADTTEADVARGQADAVLGAMARVQLKLDLMAREQSDALADIQRRLAALEAGLTPADREK